jgi:hypothetical protein
MTSSLATTSQEPTMVARLGHRLADMGQAFQVRQAPFAFIAVIALVFGVSALPSPAAAATGVAHMAVVDAGSSGSRIAAYTPGPLQLGSPTRVMAAEPDVAPLSSFEKDPAQAGPQGIGPLLDVLDDFVVSQGLAKSDVPVSVLATAGLRNVERRDPNAAAAIIASVTAYIPTRGYPVGEVGIMSGQREALYAWVDANAASGTLADGDNTLGIVEVGGASAQVAFQSPKPDGRGVLTTTIGDLTFHVVALSYLGLGQNDARMFMRQSPTQGAECFPNNAPKANPRFYEVKATKPLRASRANFQSRECRVAYDAVITEQGASALNRANNARIKPTGIRNLPGFNQSTFLGVSSIAFNMATFKLSPGPRLGTRFQKAFRSTCTGKNAWKSVTALYASASDPFAEGLCANSEYVYALAYGAKGVGVPQNKLQVDVTLTQGQPSWSKGFALTQLNP